MVYVLLADGTEEIEALSPVDVLRRGGVAVKTVGVTGKTVCLSHKVTVTCDLSIDELNLEEEKPEAVILPGGMPGTINLENSARVHKLIDRVAENDGLLCAICAGTCSRESARLLSRVLKKIYTAQRFVKEKLSCGTEILSQHAAQALHLHLLSLSFLL